MLQFHDGNVFGVAAHPAQALFATTGHFGQLQLWDYDAQALRASRRFDKLMGHRLAFDPLGQFIGTSSLLSSPLPHPFSSPPLRLFPPLLSFSTLTLMYSGWIHEWDRARGVRRRLA